MMIVTFLVSLFDNDNHWTDRHSQRI